VLDQTTLPRGAAIGLRARQSPLPEIAKSLSGVDASRSIAIIALQWLCIVGAIIIADHSGAGPLHWLVAFAAIVFIASRQQALAVLVHEGAHYRLFANRRLNDTVCDLFCGLPVFMLTLRYRQTHMGHHLEPLGAEDPDWVIMRANPREWSWPRTARAGAIQLLRDAAGLSFLPYLQQWSAWSPLRNHFGKAAYPEPLTPEIRLRVYVFFTAVAVIALAGFWRELLLYWMLPLATVSQLIFRIRTISEHMGTGDGSGMGYTRNVHPGLAERILISPLNVNHHLSHHLFPGVPWYRLPELTKRLNEDEQFRAAAFASPSYLGKDGVIRRDLTV
jgi:fatty acid desaturase